MNELFSFDRFLGSLPAGGFSGHGTEAFRIRAPESVFVRPDLQVIDTCEEPLVTLVSARGATGKSHLAEQVSAIKQVPLWLLNKDKAVSGDALRARLRDYTDTRDGFERLTDDPGSFILVDALDEARMRVSGDSWYDYVQTLFDASQKTHSLVLFGRERVLEDIWANFPGKANWFEISHFDAEQRTNYIDLYVAQARSAEQASYAETRDTVIRALSGAVEGQQEADSFIGYAPVLFAVARLLEKGNLLNIRAAFESEVGNRRRIKVLSEIIERLLKREQEKTGRLAEQLGVPAEDMYGPDEQIDWLAHHLMGARKPELAWCPSSRQSQYLRLIGEFIDDHPFRVGNRWANPVFSAYVAAERFDKNEVQESLPDVGAATGLLFEFMAAKENHILVDEWQFAALHASLMASERHNGVVSVSLNGGDPATSREDSTSTGATSGELTLWESSGNRSSIDVDVFHEEGVLALKGPLASLSLVFPGKVTVDPPYGSATFGPDCYIRCQDLRISGESVQISLRQNVAREELHDAGGGPDVTFEVTGGLLCNAQLSGDPPPDSFELVMPPDSRIGYPWFTYRKEMDLGAGEPNERAVRFIKMLMNLMRNHGHKGTPAVFDKKLEGRQSVKGDEFRRVVGRLRTEGVVSLNGPMIHLTQDWTTHRFSGKERAGVQTFDDKREVWKPVIEAIAEVMDA
ncbi:hypothetical protein ABZ892_08820 [Streptomyces sp. NPDC046924]|uniref:hypothetical protein n=1 Tax=Streptomyces sp. NPDC046924 TaxID=3155136 RepID=UPI0033E96BAF